MKITDKQRVNFVQRHSAQVIELACWRIKIGFGITWDKTTMPFNVFEGITWRQAVDKAINAYIGGKK